MSAPAMFTPINAGALHLKHHIVLAPLTRLRANKEHVPPPYAAEYYAQRALQQDGGLLITEATFIAEEAGGLAGAPGIWSKDQVAAWKKVTDAVHAKGGLIASQLWALGRVANPKLVDTVVGPSDDDYEGSSVKALSEADMDRFVGHYEQAARNALEAGFDAVEIHGANGYLLDQFLQEKSNKRTDKYGGSAENRARFPLRVLNAVAAVAGADRVALRTSPFSEFQGMRDADPVKTFTPWLETVVNAQPKLAYIHAVEPRISGSSDAESAGSDDTLAPFRKIVQSKDITFMVAGGYTPAAAIEHVNEYPKDLVAFGRYFISNPDLVQRVQHGQELTPYNRDVFYTPGEHGYTDYPSYKAQALTA